MRLAAAIFIALFCWTAPTYAQSSEALFTPTQIFARAKNSVFKLETRLIGKTAGREHGTAFVVGTAGLLATNFHVVADFVARPERYEMVLHLPTGPVQAKVLAIDPVNDVAIIKVAQNFASELPVTLSQSPAIGDALYSIGFPKSEEITLTQGSFNGQRVMGLANVMALAMPLNPGMSGGPCFDRFGIVVGINRALAVSAQNISYLSPNAALTALIARAKSVAPLADFKPEIVQAIKTQEQWALNNLTGVRERQRVGKFSFAAPLTSLICGQDKAGLSRSETEYIFCRTPSLALLGEEHEALNVSIAAVKSESSIVPVTAFNLIKDSYKRALEKPENKNERHVASVAPSEKCNARVVRNSHKVEMSVRFCSVQVPEFDGLYNTFVRIDLVERTRGSTSLAQSFEGMSMATTGQMVQAFVEGIALEP